MAITGILIAVLPQNSFAQTKADTLNRYIGELQGSVDDVAIRQKIISLVLTMDPAPAVPEGLERYMVRGKTALDLSKDNKEYKDAIAEFEKATLSAPWVGTAYYNLAISQELADDLAGAMKNYKFYLLAEPNATDAKEVKTKIYELEFKIEKKVALEKIQFTDPRDGNVYKMITIGTQTWMARNLAYKTNGGCKAINNNESNVPLYGYEYNWETAKIACPAGWHLPTDAEWTQLIDYLGGKKLAGNKLREPGFAASGLSEYSYDWWTSADEKKSFHRVLLYVSKSTVEIDSWSKKLGELFCPIRCIKD